MKKTNKKQNFSIIYHLSFVTQKVTDNSALLTPNSQLNIHFLESEALALHKLLTFLPNYQIRTSNLQVAILIQTNELKS